MIRKANLTAMVAALALAGAPIAYAGSALAAPAPTVDGQSSAAASPGIAKSDSAAPSAAAKPAASPAKPKIRYIGFSDRESRRDIDAFGNSRISLDQAIRHAQDQLHGQAIEASFRAARQPHYLVRVLDDGRVTTAAVDAGSGKVTSMGHPVSLDRLYPRERADALRTMKARTDLAQAVAFARRDSGDKPIAASLAGSRNTRGYEIFVVDHHMLQSVWISPDNWPQVAMK